MWIELYDYIEESAGIGFDHCIGKEIVYCEIDSLETTRLPIDSDYHDTDYRIKGYHTTVYNTIHPAYYPKMLAITMINKNKMYFFTGTKEDGKTIVWSRNIQNSRLFVTREQTERLSCFMIPRTYSIKLEKVYV